MRAEDADAYVEYLEETGLSAYRATPGNQGVYGLRRIDGDRCEFLLVTLWDDMDAVRAFAGDDPKRRSSIRRTIGTWWTGTSCPTTTRWSRPPSRAEPV